MPFAFHIYRSARSWYRYHRYYVLINTRYDNKVTDNIVEQGVLLMWYIYIFIMLSVMRAVNTEYTE